MIVQIPDWDTVYVDLRAIVAIDLLTKKIFLSSGAVYEILRLDQITKMFNLWVKEHGPLVDMDLELQRDRRKMLIEEHD